MEDTLKLHCQFARHFIVLLEKILRWGRDESLDSAGQPFHEPAKHTPGAPHHATWQ